MRQERHTGIKQSSIFDSELGEVERETRGVPLTGSPCLREKMLCEFSDLLLCCLLPAPLREQTVMARALIQRKTPCGWSKGNSIGWKRSSCFFQNIVCVPENGQLCSLWEWVSCYDAPLRCSETSMASLTHFAIWRKYSSLGGYTAFK